MLKKLQKYLSGPIEEMAAKNQDYFSDLCDEDFRKDLEDYVSLKIKERAPENALNVQAALKGFRDAYEKESKWCNNDPEVPQFVYDTLNHVTVRSHCFGVCRDLLENVKNRHVELLKEFTMRSQNGAYSNEERDAYLFCAEKLQAMLKD